MKKKIKKKRCFVHYSVKFYLSFANKEKKNSTLFQFEFHFFLLLFLKFFNIYSSYCSSAERIVKIVVHNLYSENIVL